MRKITLLHVLTAALFVAGIFAIPFFSKWRSHWERARTAYFLATNTFQPFTAIKVFTMICNGIEAPPQEIIEARRANGDWVMLFGKTLIHGTERKFRLSNGNSAFAVDNAKVMYTTRDRAPLGWTANPENCTSSFEGAVFEGFEPAGREIMNGVEVIKMKRPEGFSWYAPSLHCAELKRDGALPNKPGTAPTINRISTTAVIQGEPDPALFNLDGFEELKPSEVAIRKWELVMNSEARTDADWEVWKAAQSKIRASFTKTDAVYEVAHNRR